MKKLFRTIILFVPLVFTACMGFPSAAEIQGSGKSASEDRPVQGISGVELTTFGDLTIQLGDQETLRIEADDNLLSYIETPVRSGVLIIQTKSGTNLRPVKPVRYTLTLKSLHTVAVSSSGNIDVPAIQTGKLTTRISSSGNIHFASLQADSLDVSISSSGNLEIDAGQVAQQNITITSSGEYSAGNVRSQSADVRISSNGNATLWVTDSLNADLTSSGDVEYYGRPAITQSMTSSGKVVSLGDK